MVATAVRSGVVFQQYHHPTHPTYRTFSEERRGIRAATRPLGYQERPMTHRVPSCVIPWKPGQRMAVEFRGLALGQPGIVQRKMDGARPVRVSGRGGRKPSLLTWLCRRLAGDVYCV